MPEQVARRSTPEEIELIRKREELSAISAVLAERELELIDLRTTLSAFQGRYLREVGTLYAELDEWNARIEEARARLNPSDASNFQADEARRKARESYEEAQAESSEAREFTPSPELKKMYREAARRIHPDFAANADDCERRTRLMAEANRAYENGDEEALRRILRDYESSPDLVEGDSIGAELVRTIRRISIATERVAAIENELVSLRQGEIGLLKAQADAREENGGDLLAELAGIVREQIEAARRTYADIAKADCAP